MSYLAARESKKVRLEAVRVGEEDGGVIVGMGVGGWRVSLLGRG